MMEFCLCWSEVNLRRFFWTQCRHILHWSW